MKNAAQLKQIKAAVIQINSGDDKEKNFARAESLIREASSRGATVIALPETFSWRGSRKYIFKNAQHYFFFRICFLVVKLMIPVIIFIYFTSSFSEEYKFCIRYGRNNDPLFCKMPKIF